MGSADGAGHDTIRTVHTTYAAAVKTTTLPKTRCRKPYAATQHLILISAPCISSNYLISIPTDAHT